MPETAGSVVQAADGGDDRRLGGVGRQRLVAIAQPHLSAELLYRSAVHARPEVIAHHERGDARIGTRGPQFFQFTRKLFPHLGGDGFPIDDLGCHSCLPFLDGPR